MISMKRAVMIMAIISAFPATCPGEPAPHRLEPVAVSASEETEAFDSPYRVPESSRAATWEVDEEEIEAMHPETLYDILATAPGVHVSFQGRKSMNFVESRGGGRYAILLDGNYVPWTQSGRILANFPTKAIASVRVVRDATVLTLGPMIEPGSQASVAQGYIIITTRKPESRETRLSAEYGNNNRYKGYASYGDNTGRLYYGVACNKSHDDGEDGWNNALDSTSLLLNGGFDNGDIRLDLTAYGDWASREIQRATEESKRHNDKWEYDPLDTLMLSARLSKRWTPSQSTAIGVYAGNVNTDLHVENYSSPAVKMFEQKDRMTQADLRHTLQTDSHLMTFGGQVIFWETPTGQFYYETMPKEEEIYSLYAHDDWTVTDRVSFDAGIRADRKHISKGVDRYAPVQSTTQLIEDEWATPTLCMAAGTEYRMSETYALSGRYSFARNDTDSFLTTEDNASLDAEHRHKYEAGLIAAWNPALTGTLTLFLYDFRNTKISVGSVEVGEEIVNIYDTFDVVQKGFEIGFKGTLSAIPFSYDLNCSWQTADDDTADRKLPEKVASLRLSYTPGAYLFQFIANYADHYDSNFFATDGGWHEIGGYTCIDANIGRDFHLGGCDLRATVFGRNLTNEEYQTRLGWDHAERAFGISLDLTI